MLLALCKLCFVVSTSMGCVSESFEERKDQHQLKYFIGTTYTANTMTMIGSSRAVNISRPDWIEHIQKSESPPRSAHLARNF